MDIRKIASTAMGGISIFASCAFAQGASQTDKNTPEAEGWTERESLFLAAVAEDISKDSGFTPSLNWTGEIWSNVSDGRDIHTIADSLFTLGFEQDYPPSERQTGLEE